MGFIKDKKEYSDLILIKQKRMTLKIEKSKQYYTFKVTMISLNRVWSI